MGAVIKRFFEEKEACPSWAVALPLSEAGMIGANSAQDAIYFMHGDELRVVSCGDPSSQIVAPPRAHRGR
ncbi:hypothetical protein [Gaopeijia maritima]|uniref:hypothetical protein n=1 Tax=Gaopeijia maritima TaxID=3119007 RepID=UPI0032765609